MKKSRFPAAAMPADGNELAGLNGEIDSAQGLDSPFVVTLVHVTHFENGASHAAAPPSGQNVRRQDGSEAVLMSQ